MKFICVLLIYSRRAVHFRRALADANHDKDTLQELWNAQKREGMENLVKSLESIKEEDQEEFINILDSYFDEEKKPAKPPMNPNAHMHRRDSTSNNGGGRKGGMRHRRNSHNMNGKENRGSRNNSRRRRPQPRNNSKRRFSGNGNVGHEMSHKMGKDHQHEMNSPMVAAH